MGAMHPILDDEAGDWPPVNDDPTLCVECDRVHPDTLAKPPYQWRCMAHPAPPFGGFVNPNWRPDPPYHRCQDANRNGACEFWTPRRMPKEASDEPR